MERVRVAKVLCRASNSSRAGRRGTVFGRLRRADWLPITTETNKEEQLHKTIESQSMDSQESGEEERGGLALSSDSSTSDDESAQSDSYDDERSDVSYDDDRSDYDGDELDQELEALSRDTDHLMRLSEGDAGESAELLAL